MNWFQGSIPEGIQIARLSKGFLVVFVYDKEEESVDSRNVLDMEEFSDQIVLPEFTAIELENGSPNAKQFAEIYPLLTVPCLFFIDGVSGVPLEVIGGKVEEEYLRTKISRLTKSNTVDEQKTAASTEQPKDDPSPCVSTESNPGPSSNSGVSDGIAVEIKEQDTSPEEDLQEKVEKARILAEQIQIQKQKEAEEDERRKEVERRKIGMEMAKAKARREELELEQAIKQRKKDKEDERLARERVKAQIAADKAEREARAARARGDTTEPLAQPARPVPPAAPIDNDSTVRIKFRLSDGSSNIGLFKAEEKLTALHDHLRLNVPSLPSRYQLVSALDGSKLTDDHLSSTLAELNLAPSAIVIVKISSSQRHSALDTNFNIMNLLWVPFTYLSMIVTTVFRFLGVGASAPAPNQSEGNPPEAKRPRTEGPSTSDSRGTYGQRNIHRLRDGGDDDPDENNTWNGNSTQQM